MKNIIKKISKQITFFVVLCFSVSSCAIAESYTNYQVTFRTGCVTKAGTNADIYLTIKGLYGSTEEVHIDGLIRENAFERCDVNVVDFKAENVGRILSVKVRMDDSNYKVLAPAWFLNSIQIKKDNSIYHFHIFQWIKGFVSKIFAVIPQTTDITVTVKTSDKRKAGTDANVHLTIFGTNGKMNKVTLNRCLSGNAFEQGDTDKITFRNVKDIGDITKIIIGHDGRYAGSDWHLNSVKVQAKGRSTKTFYCNCWIEGNYDDKALN